VIRSPLTVQGYKNTAGPPAGGSTPSSHPQQPVYTGRPPPTTEHRLYTRRRPVYSETPADDSAPSLHPPTAGVQRDPRRWQHAVASPRHPPMAGVQGKHPQRAQSRQVTPPPADGQCTAGPTPTHADRRQPITLPRHPPNGRCPAGPPPTGIDMSRPSRPNRPNGRCAADQAATPADLRDHPANPPKWPVYSGTAVDSR